MSEDMENLIELLEQSVAIEQAQVPVACQHKRYTVDVHEQTGRCFDCGAEGRMRFIVDGITPAQQPEQEPVAWIQQVIDDLHALHDTELIKEVDSGDALIRLDDAIAAVEEAAQRYTPAPRQWQGLTKGEVNAWELPERPTVFEFAQFVEAKLKEKNT